MAIFSSGLKKEVVSTGLRWKGRQKGGRALTHVIHNFYSFKNKPLNGFRCGWYVTGNDSHTLRQGPLDGQC